MSSIFKTKVRDHLLLAGCKSGIEVAVGETLTLIHSNKSKLRHKAVKDTAHRYCCEYCSLKNLECSSIRCSKYERSDNQDIHFVRLIDKPVSKPL